MALSKATPAQTQTAAKKMSKKATNFERQKTAEEIANNWGNKTRIVTVTALSVFAQLGGIFFLLGSLYLSYLEALNAAEIIKRPNQFSISFGLSIMSIMFSIIGFLFFTRWLTYRRMSTEFPDIMGKELKDSGDDGKKVYALAMNQINKGSKFSGWVALVFLLGNALCSGLTVWAVVSALDFSTTPISIWIYTFSISLLALFAGACITMISNSDMDVENITDNAVAEYVKFARLSNTIVNIGNIAAQEQKTFQ